MNRKKRLYEDNKEINLDKGSLTFILKHYKKRIENDLLIERYFKWKKYNNNNELTIILSLFLIGISVSFLAVSSFIPEVLGLSTLCGLIILIKIYDKHLKSWYTSFNEDEIEAIKFFKKNGFLM